MHNPLQKDAFRNNPIKPGSISLRTAFLFALLFLLVALPMASYQWLTQESIKQGYIYAVEYLEDPKGVLALEDVRRLEQPPLGEKSPWISGENVKIGISRSHWWARIKVENIRQGSNQYFSIINPSLEDVQLHLPIDTPTGGAYKNYHAGWSYSEGDKDDEGFSYPVFKLPGELSGSGYVYLRLYSSYTQNYAFRVFGEGTYNSVKQSYVVIITFLFGIMVALGINNLIHFTSMRIRTHLYYDFYLLSMIIYQGTVLGYFRLFLGSFADRLTENIAPLGALMAISVILIFQSFLDTKRNFPRQHRISKIMLGLDVLIMAMPLVGLRFESNIAIIVLANVIGALILTTTYKAMQRKMDYARYLFAGWITMLIISTIFVARSWGLIPNMEITWIIVLIPTAVEAILISRALGEMVKSIQKDKEKFTRLYETAEGKALIRETAFLQAQIRPHFLYNALNVIESLCYIDAAKAAETTVELSKFLRHSFDFRNLETTISFNRELEFIKAYVSIEQTRFTDKLKVEYEFDDTEGLRLPPLLLQPLIENAIRHGIRKRIGPGTVTIRVKDQPGMYRIEVEDDGIGMSEEQLEEALSPDIKPEDGVGLSNIQRRLKMFYGTELKLESEPGKGTRATILLPKRRPIVI